MDLQSLLGETEPQASVFQVGLFSSVVIMSNVRHNPYCSGVASHCRKHVQDLNMQRGKLYEESVGKTEEEEDEEPDYGEMPPPVAQISWREKKPGPDVNSRWFKYT